MRERARYKRAAFAMFQLILACALCTRAQTAELSGMVRDSSQAAFPNATITATNDDTALKQTAVSNLQGYYNLAFLRPGSYTINVEAKGFRTITRRELNLDLGQEAILNFALEPATLNQTIVVQSNTPPVRSDSPGMNYIIGRQFVENLPLNGRTFQPLIALVPGVVLTNGDGQFSINGQRENANYFSIDGVSANIGLSSFRNLGLTAGGSMPGFNVLGGTNNLVSVDAIQELAIRSSAFSAEFGRTAGGQVQVLTRSGTKQLHGTLSDYFRNDALDANDWFANREGLQKAPLRQNEFGGTLAGPIFKNKTFFFLSYEGLRLRLPQFSVVNVPSRVAREQAPFFIRQLLNAFPLPNGPENSSSLLARLSTTYSNPASGDTTSARLDHVMNSRLSLFARYSFALSENDSRVESLSHVIANNVNTSSIIIGGIFAVTPMINNEFRANYSTNRSSHVNDVDDFGGTISPPGSLMFPEPFASRRSSRFIFTVDEGGLRFVVGRSADHRQRQINLVDNISILRKTHTLKFGADFRYLFPVFGPQDYGLQIRFLTLDQAVNGKTPLVSIFTFDPLVLAFRNLSVYGQDKWKLSPRTTVDFGLRWELNPPPGAKNGGQLYTLSGIGDPGALQIAPAGTPLYRTSYGNFAPRIGLAYQMSGRPGREISLRGGLGIFYDLGDGVIGQATESFPHFRRKFVSGQRFPLNSLTLAPPALPSLDPPYSAQSFLVFDPHHVLPRTYQWNVGLEGSLGVARTISVFYVGAAGRDLLRRVGTTALGPNFINGSTVDLTTNDSTSDYHALQLRFQHQLSRGLQSLVSYTWSHSIDNGSSDAGFELPANKTPPQSDRGPSDFDVRHAVQVAFTYKIPSPRVRGVAFVLHDWSIDGILLARTATPVDVTITRQLGFDLVSARPDQVPGEHDYIGNPAVPEGRQINSAAFAVAAEQRQGLLQRNALRGFAFTQLDCGVSREFHLTERVNIRGKAEFFNVFNHPNFANPDGFLGTYSPPLAVNSFFGFSTGMSARAPAAGVMNGLTSLYRMGGPRSIQLSLKFAF
jgi:hypothetical protein